MTKQRNIKEVWDYRLSTASVYIDRRGGTWVCVVIAKEASDYKAGDTPNKPLEVHDTGIKATHGDTYNNDKLSVCFDWFKSVRDKYALSNIEELKPVVKTINEANEKLAQLGAAK